MSDLMQSSVKIGIAVMIAATVASGAWFMAGLHMSVETMSTTLAGIDQKLESLPNLSFQVSDNAADLQRMRERIRWLEEDVSADFRWLEEVVGVHRMYVEALRRELGKAGLDPPAPPDLPKRPPKKPRGDP